MKFSSVLLVSLLLFNGCTTDVVKDLRSYLGYDEEALLALKKGVISQDGDTKATIQAIYLNSADNELYQSGENFFVAVYIADDFDESKNYGLKNSRYRLTLNDNEAVKVIELDESSTLRKEMPLKSRWSHYYHVVFDKSKAEELKLTFAYKNLAKSVLAYQKELQQK